MVVIEPPRETLKLLRESLNQAAEVDDLLADGESEEVLAYCAALASSLAQAKVFTSEMWMDTLMPYMESLPSLYGTTERAQQSIQRFCDLTEQASYADVDATEDEEDEFGGEELCDIRFSLAYGGKILLHNTKLRLRRGHRYALVGQNGVGKTTLMSAINKGKLEGWPIHLRTEYVDSGSNVDPEYEAKIVFDHLVDSTKKSAEECRALLEVLKFTPSMMEGSIGELSGGWQMKLRLCKAVLVNADILLLDEPTNHVRRYVYIISAFFLRFSYILLFSLVGFQNC